MKRRPDAAGAIAAVAAVAALASSAAAQPEGPPNLGWADAERLRAGEVERRTGKKNLLTVTADAAIRIDAEPEAIWEVLTACEIAPELVSNVRSCSLVETLEGGRAQLFAQTVKPAFFLPAFEHVFRLDYEPYTRIDVSRVSGPIAHMEGFWQLLEQPDGAVIVVHHLELDPGMPVPRFFVRAALRRDLPRVLEAVRDRAESSA